MAGKQEERRSGSNNNRERGVCWWWAIKAPKWMKPNHLSPLLGESRKGGFKLSFSAIGDKKISGRIGRVLSIIAIDDQVLVTEAPPFVVSPICDYRR